MPATRPMPPFSRVSALLLLVALSTSGCTAMTVAGIVMDAMTEVSVTVHGGEDVQESLQEHLKEEFGVDAVISAVETGEFIVELVGTYAAVVDALTWMASQGLELLANDAISETVLSVAIALMK